MARKPRYYVQTVNIYPRPFRVIDGRKGTILLQSGDKVLADSLAAEYERQWQERPRRFPRLRKFFSRLFSSARSDRHERTA